MDHVHLPAASDGVCPIDVVYAPVYFARQRRSNRMTSDPSPFDKYWQLYSKTVHSFSFGSTIRGEYWRLPELLGFDREKLLQGDFGEREPQETLALLTDWLYFGMLGEVTGQLVIADDFLVKRGVPSQKGFRGGKDTVVLTTKSLPSLLQSWWQDYMEYDNAKTTKSNERMNACLTVVWRLVTEHAESFAALCPPLGRQAHFAIAILGELLQETKARLWGSHRAYQNGMRAVIYRGPNPGKDFLGQVRWGPSPLLRRRMLRMGCCRAEISRLETILPVLGVYYATFLRKENPKKVHQHCSNEHCTREIIDEKLYKAKHTHTDLRPDCNLVRSPVDKVMKILSDGGIPLIKLSRPKTPKGAGKIADLVLDVVDARNEKKPRYVAISHVWADGLGDTIGNSLPACQLDRLESFVTNLLLKHEKQAWEYTSLGKVSALVKESWNHAIGAPCLLWIDTLCVPRGETEEMKNLRNVAINRMVDTYKEAFRVLVLDAELLEIESSRRDEEIIMRVTCSGWMRRMWTLQETILGATGSRLYIQCKDGTVNLFERTIPTRPENMHIEMISVYNRTTQPVPYYVWKQNRFYDFGVYIRKPVDCHIRYYWENVYEIHQSSQGKRFMYVWNETRWRSASHEEDRPLVVGTLLGLDTRPILEAGGDVNNRMAKLFELLKTVPANILFLSGPRLKQNRMAWAPAIFSKIERLNIKTDGPGVVTRAGLEVFLPGWILKRKQSPLVLDENDEFQLLENNRLHSITVYANRSGRGGKSTLQYFLPRPQADFAIIFEKGNAMEIKRMPKSTKMSRRGILVQLDEITTREVGQEKIVVVSYGCQVKISSGPLDDFSEDPLDPETNSSNMAVVDTRPLFEDDVVSLYSQEAEEEYEQGTEDESEEDGSQRDSRQGQDESSDEDFDQHYPKWVSQDKKYMRWWRVG